MFQKRRNHSLWWMCKKIVLFYIKYFNILCNINKLMVPVFYLITNHICSVMIPLCSVFMCVYAVYSKTCLKPFIKRNFVLNGNIFRSHDYHSIPRLNGNLASAEKCSGPLRFHLRQVLLNSLSLPKKDYVALLSSKFWFIIRLMQHKY
jgi:hypothetical protein